MQSIKPGDPIAPVTALHVLGLKDVSGVVFRLEFITRNDQPADRASVSPSYVLKPSLARTLAKQLMDAADTAEGQTVSFPDQSLAATPKA